MTRMPNPEASPASAAREQTRNGVRAGAPWLLACCALVFAMVVVGGVTRLTHSGLSIVEWQPIVGALPPLDEAGWQETFGKYKQTPEYRLGNPHMTLEGFKNIFWWEYVHRLLGRLVGAGLPRPRLWVAARGIQEHFLVGVCPSAPGQADRRGIPAAAPVVRAARKNRPRADVEICGDIRAGRVAGRAGLVH